MQGNAVDHARHSCQHTPDRSENTRGFNKAFVTGLGHRQSFAGRRPGRAAWIAGLALCVLSLQAVALDVSGPISVDTQWRVSDSPVRILSTVTVESGAHLAIEAGVVVRFAAESQLIVRDGSLAAVGTSSARVRFESNLTTPSAGDWGPLVLESGTVSSRTELDRVDLRQGKGLRVEAAAPTLSNIHFEHNQGAAMQIDLASSPMGSGLTAAGNDINGILVPAGTIDAEVRWGLVGIPYVVEQGIVEVGRPGVRLTPTVLQLREGDSEQFQVRLAEPAPASGLVLDLQNSAPAVLQTPPTVQVPAGQIEVAFPVQALAFGAARLTLSHPELGSEVANVTVLRQLRVILSPSEVFLRPDEPGSVIVRLSEPAPAPGVTVTLASSNPASVTLPATIDFPTGSGEIDRYVDVQAHAVGQSTISATAVGFSGATTLVRVREPALGLATTGPVYTGLESTLVVEISHPPQSKGEQVELLNDNPVVLEVPDGVFLGPSSMSGEATIFGLAPGMARVVATASGFASAEINLEVVAFSLSFDPAVSPVIPSGSSQAFEIRSNIPAPYDLYLYPESADSGIAGLSDGDFPMIPEGQTVAIYPLLVFAQAESGSTQIHLKTNAERPPLASLSVTVGPPVDSHDPSSLRMRPKSVESQVAELRISDGVVVKFGAGAGIDVFRRIRTDGLVAFTSLRDSDIGGVTLPGGGIPQRGDWRGLAIDLDAPVDSAVLDGAELRYATVGLRLAGPHSVKRMHIHQGQTGLLAAEGGGARVSDSRLDQNLVGFLADTHTNLQVDASTVADNSVRGGENRTPARVVNARGNWWGSSTGPRDPVGNPSGQGNSVTAGIDYGQYLNQPPLVACQIFAANHVYAVVLRAVQLRMICPRATQYRLSESPSFGAAPFYPFASTVPFVLSEGAGAKTVYAEFRGAFGETRVVAIPQPFILDPSIPQVAFTEPVDGAILEGSTWLRADATDPAGIARVEFLAGGSLVGSDTVPPFEAFWDVTGVQDGSYELTATAINGEGRTSSVNRAVTVLRMRPEPDAYAVDEGSLLHVPAPGVLANDLLVSSGAIELVTSPEWGFLDLRPDGSLSFDPGDPDRHGETQFTYRLRNGPLASAITVVTLTVRAVNDSPVAIADEYLTDENVQINVAAPGLLENDTDIDSAALRAAVARPPDHGQVQIAPTGAFSYVPAINFRGTDTFEYSAIDDEGGAFNSTVTIRVTQPPTATNDLYLVDADTALVVDSVESGLLANDHDAPEDDPLTVAITRPPEHGTLQWLPNGTFRYMPDPGYTGLDTMRYQISDGRSNSNVATVTLGVGITSLPLAIADEYTFNEDEELIVPATQGVLVNDIDADTPPSELRATITYIAEYTFASLDLDEDGSFRVRTAANWSGETFFLYRVFDGSHVSNEALVRLTVLPVNDGVIAEDDQFGVLRNGVFQSGVGVYYGQSITNNDEYDPAFEVNYELVQPPQQGVAVLDTQTGALLYTPPTEFSGTTQLVYRAFQTETGIGDTATVSFRTNGPPVAGDDFYEIDEDTSNALIPNPLANDLDPEGDPMSVITYGVRQGLCDYAFSIDFDPVSPQIHMGGNYYGTCEVSYTLSDGLLTTTGRIFFTVRPAPDDPVAFNDYYLVQQDATLLVVDVQQGILGNDSDPDSRYPWASGPDLLPLQIEQLSNAAHGVLSLAADGTLEYTPATGFSGQDQFTYRLRDGTGRHSSPATVIIRVNSPPQAVADQYAVDEDTVLAVVAPGVLGNDLDADNDALRMEFSHCIECNGELSLLGDGGFRFTPNPNFYGESRFAYYARDEIASSFAEVTITVRPVNDAPVTEPDAYRVDEDVPLSVPFQLGVLRNDREVDGEALINAQLVTAPSHGTVVIDTDGGFNYTPNANYHGTDSFRYRVFDESSLNTDEDVLITLEPVNDSPIAAPDLNSIRKDLVLDVAAAAGVLANDSDIDGDLLSVTLAGPPLHGQVHLRPDGSYVYQPDGQFVGTDVFQYQVADGLGGVAASTVSVQVLDTPRPVVITTEDDQYVVSGGQLAVPAPGILGNDSVSGAPLLTASLVVPPAVGTAAVQADGAFSYVAPANYQGTVTFSYSASAVGESEFALVTLDVRNAPNLAPTAAGEQFGLLEDGELDSRSSGGLLANDDDPEGLPLVLQLVQGTAHGELTVDPDGHFSYRPARDFHGSDSLRYRVSDGQLQSNDVIASFSVFAQNDAPTSQNDAYQTARGSALSVAPQTGVLANDSDVDGDPLTVEMHDAPWHGQVVVEADGSFLYTPAAAFTGLDQFRYAVTDGRLRALATVAVNVVSPGNQAPVAVGESLQLDEDSHIGSDTVGLLTANDSDPDGDTLFVVLHAPPAHGQLTLDGAAFSYRPSPDFHGDDQFQYRVTDGALSTDPVSVVIQVRPVNDAPRTGTDLYAITQGQTLSVGGGQGVLANDTDVEGDPITVSVLSPPAHGTLALSPNGAFVYEGRPGFHGRDEFGYRAADAEAESVGRAIIDVTQAPNQRPVAIGETFAIPEDTLLDTRQLQSLLANDVDADGQVLSLVMLTQPPRGTLEVFPGGHILYTPVRDDHGSMVFDYTVSDGELQAEPVQVQIQLLPQPDAPQAQPDLYSLAASEASLSVDAATGVLANDVDPDGDTLLATLVQPPSSGELNLGLDGGFTFTPPSPRPSSVEFSYRISDSSGQNAQASVRILLGGTPPADLIFAADFEGAGR